MALWDTFGGVPVEPSREVAEARIEWQDEQLWALVEPLVTEGVNAIGMQEDELRELYKPLVRDAAARIRLNRDRAGEIISHLLMTIRGVISRQAAILSQIESQTEQLGAIAPWHEDEPAEGEPEVPGLGLGEDPGKIPPPPPVSGEEPDSSIPAPIGGPTFVVPGLLPGGFVPPMPLGPAAGLDPLGVVRPPMPVPMPPGAKPPAGGPVPIPPLPGVPVIPGVPPGFIPGLPPGAPPKPPGAPPALPGTPGGPLVPLPGPTIELVLEEPPAPPTGTVTFPDDEPEQPDTEPGSPPPGEISPPEVPGEDSTPQRPTPPGESPVGTPKPPIAVIPSTCEWDAGDPQLCVTVSAYLGPFGQIGQRIEELLDLMTVGVPTGFKAFLDALAVVPVMGVPLKLLVEMLPLDTVIETLKQMRDLPRAAKHTKTLTLIGLWGVKALVRLLEEATVGWELGPQLLLSLRYEMPQLHKIIDYLIDFVCPVDVPSPQNVLPLVMHNVITQDHADCLAAMGGYSAKVLNLTMLGNREKPDALQAVRDWMRFRFPQQELYKKLRGNGWLIQSEMDEFIRANEFLPPPTDLIRFAVKDVFDPEKLGKDEMLAELETQTELLNLLSYQGIGKIKGSDGKGGQTEWNIPFYYWLAAYDEISPTQSYEMLHRLRPDRVARFRQEVEPTLAQKNSGKVAGARVVEKKANGRWVVEPEPFSLSDVQRLLKEVDYNPLWRVRLASISYRPLGRIDVRRIYDTGGFGKPQGLGGFQTQADGKQVATGPAEKELQAQYEDQGYVGEDATLLARFTAYEWTNRKKKAASGKALSIICDSYQTGALSVDQAIGMAEVHLEDRKAAERFIGECDARRKLATLKKSIGAVRSLFLRGELDTLQTRNQLNTLGIDQARIREYLQLWEIERAARKKEVVAATMCGWLESGLITQPEFKARLMRIGYESVDADRIIRHCELGILAKRSAELQKLAKAQAAQAERQRQAAEKLRKEGERTAERTLTKWLAARSEKNLIAFFKKKEIDEKEIRATLKLKGWLAKDIDRWVNTYTPKEGEGGEDEGDQE